MQRYLLYISLFCTVLFSDILPKEFRAATAGQLSSAISSVQPGDTITMLNGTWSNVTVSFTATGTAEKPILLRAESLGAVLLNGTSALKIAGKYLTVDGLTFQNGYLTSGSVIEFRISTSVGSSYCRLTNTSIIDYNPPDSTVDVKWVSLYGDHNRVDHCYLKGKTNLGTTLVVWLAATPNYHQIDHNYFGPRPDLGLNGGETIRVGTSDWSMYDSYTIVENNLFEECNGEIEIISNKSCGNIYRYNTFRSCRGTLTLRHGNRCTVEGNFFFGNHVSNSGGIRIIGEDHKVFNNYISGTSGSGARSALSMMEGIPNSVASGYFQVKRAAVANNTLVDNVYNFAVGVGKDTQLTQPPLDCVVANNVMYGTSSILVTFTDTPINMTWQSNIFFGTSTGFPSLPARNVVADPKLAAVGADGLRHLTNASPAINKATGSWPFIVNDMDGQVRDSLPDIGADEYSTNPVVNHPLKASEVGPGSQLTQIKSQGTVIPNSLQLYQNYPNPFNPTTRIRYQLAVKSIVSLDLYSVDGARIASLISGREQLSGAYAVELDAADLKLASGIYFYRLSTVSGTGQSVVRTNKMILLK